MTFSVGMLRTGATGAIYSSASAYYYYSSLMCYVLILLNFLKFELFKFNGINFKFNLSLKKLNFEIFIN
jgi:hypothetical protein